MTDYGTYPFDEFIECLKRARDLHDEERGGPQDEYMTLELLAMAVDAAGMLDAGWKCFGCGQDAFAMGEDFYVHDDLWRTYGVEGVLCIGCLETRMDRKLTPEDFYDGGHKRKLTKRETKEVREWRARMGYTPSERLLDRCGGDYPGMDGYIKEV
jgi:hypothetical protein